MRALFAFACGALFGAGLIVSGMTDPANVKGFLDVTGNWRPQLAGVLGAAVVVTWILFTLARRRSAPFAAEAFEWPRRTDVDRRLVLGAALFGVGWALAGYCPGPALTSLGALSMEAWVFVPAMAVGMWIANPIASPAPARG